MTATVLPALVRIATDRVHPGQNPRGGLGDPQELAELRRSIARFGITTPLFVRESPELPDHYEVIDGHRRLSCIRALKLPTVVAVLRRIDDPALLLALQLSMHVQRAAFDPIAEAHILNTLMFDHGYTREDIGEMLGKPPTWVRDRLALLNLSPGEQDAVVRRDLSLSTALARVQSHRAATGTRAPSGPRPSMAPRSTTGRRRGIAPSQTEPHLNSSHPLASVANQQCRGAASHAGRPWIGDVACGECWEAAIRADVTATFHRDAGARHVPVTAGRVAA